MADQVNDEKEEDNLWAEYRKTKAPALRDKFIRQYMPLVKYVAGKISVGMPNSVEFDDLVGFGQFGLLDAIEKYDPEKNVKFKTYAVTRIRGAIFDELRQIDWVPRSVRQKSREIEDTINSLEARLGRTAGDSEIADALGMSEDDYHRTIMKVSGTSVLSLNDVWYNGDDSGNMSIGDSIESPSSMNPDSIVEREEIKKVIIQAINELPEKEKMVIVLYYHEDLTFKEIGQVLNVSESRISQLHTKANLRLRAKLTNLRKGIV
jgi:RNA polymerase sigma factor, FliA/WhiG family/RNA polymerase sigma factor, sigma-70 family